MKKVEIVFKVFGTKLVRVHGMTRSFSYSLYTRLQHALGGTTTIAVFATVLSLPEWSHGPRIFLLSCFIPYPTSLLSPTARVTIDGGRNIGRGIVGIVNLE